MSESFQAALNLTLIIIVGVNVFLLVKFLNLCSNVQQITKLMKANDYRTIIGVAEGKLSRIMSRLEKRLDSYDPQRTPDITPDDIIAEAKQEMQQEISRMDTVLSGYKYGKAPKYLQSADAYYAYYSEAH